MNNLLIKVSALIAMSIFSIGVFSDVNDGIDISMAVMFDYSVNEGNTQNSLDNSPEFNSELRRARVNFKHKLNKDWNAKLQISFEEEDDGSEVGDAYVRYSGWKSLQLTMGKFKEPFGLENMTSTKNTTFLERSMVSSAFSPDKNKGLMLSGSPGSTSWAFALIDLEAEDKEHAPYAMSARGSWGVISSTDQTLHFGLSGSLRMLDGEKFEVDERAEIHSLKKVVESGSIETDKLLLTAVDFSWVGGPMSLQSEYMHADLDAVNSNESITMNGYYFQMSYFLTGERRNYKRGAFYAITPNSKKGAWELTTRYSVLDVTDASDGSRQNTTTLGINYYYDDNIRLIGNLLHSQSSEYVNGSREGNGVGFRIQYLF